MKRYIRGNKRKVINFEVVINIDYVHYSAKIAASKELDSMNLSEFDERIVNFPDDVPYNTKTNEYMRFIMNTDAYKKFIKLVNKIDELLELRHYDILGESEFTKTNTESKYRGVVMNVSKDLDSDTHLSGKIMHTLRFSGHKETRTSRRTRWKKISDAANSDKAKEIGGGEPLPIGEFESFVVKCTVDSKEFAKIENKEFYTYADIIRCVDKVLDELETDV